MHGRTSARRGGVPSFGLGGRQHARTRRSIPGIAGRALLAAALVAVAGCGRSEPSAETAAGQLEKAFPEGTGSDAVRVAISAAQAKDYPATVVALDAAKATPGMTAQQLAAMEQARQTVIGDLTRKADAGDAAAKAQLSAIERSRSQ